jgi:hypothetical protein
MIVFRSDHFGQAVVPLKRHRGDKTAIELFLAGVRGWEGHVRRQLDDGKPKAD